MTVLLAAAAGFAVAALAWLVLPRRLLRSRKLALQAPSMAGGAVAALLATSHATAWAASDGFWRAVVGAGAAALGAYASPFVLLSASAAVGLAAGGPWDIVAGAAAGTAAASGAMGRRSRPLGALAGAAAAAAAFHLERPGGNLAGAVGIVALSAIAVGGLAAMSLRRRRLVMGRVGLAAVPLVGLAGVGAVSVLAARPAVERGADLVEIALDQTRNGEVEDGETVFRRAASSFGSGRADLDAWWAVPVRALPVIGANLDVASTLAERGAVLSEVGASALGAARFDEIRLTNGSVPVDRLAALVEPARKTERELAETGRVLGGVARAWLAPPLADGLVDLESRVERAHDDALLAIEVAETVPAMLGADGPRRYLLAIVTPSEARGSGGILGNYGEVVADKGRLSLSRLGRSSDLNEVNEGRRKLTGPPEYLGRLAPFHPERFWQNVMLSPDFPTVAGAAVELYPQSGGQPVDGVISVDPIFLARLLRLLGPVPVPGVPVPLTAKNAEQELLFDQYVRLAGSDRIDYLGDASQRIWDRLTAGALPGPRKMATTLGPAVAARHLQIASVHADEQRLLDRVGISGRVPDVEGDAVGVVTENASGNKIDWFLDRSYSYDVRIDDAGRLEASLHLELRNRAPASGLPAYVIGPFPGIGTAAGLNRMMLSIYSPWGLDGATINGETLLVESARELGRSVYSTFIDVPAGKTAVIDVKLAGVYPDAPYRLDVLRQPMVRPDTIRSTVYDAR